ncbi:MAG: BMP family ABC transporter substrate-binding protein [Thermaceae bacterium]|nr:BMP family ABC transporter substrate-binding protein [Thermaceae bacterium]
MKLRWIALAAVFLGAMGLAQSAKLKACFVYVGPPGDYGWTFAHDQGRKLAEKALPWLETKYVESVPEGQAMPFIDKFVKDGCQVIFTTSFGYMDETVAAAKKYPNVIFAHNAGYKRAPNLATYMADFYQVYYLSGLMAGALTKTDKVGYVGAYPVPEVKRHIDAFALGVQATNPKATVNVKWINAWFDPAKAAEAANALIAEGSDVFSYTEDSPTTIQVAAKKNLLAIGSHYSPMLKYAPNNVVSGQIVHWDKIYIDFLTKVHNGTYTNKNLQNVDYWWLLSHNAVELGADINMPINPKFIPALKAKMVKDSAGKMVSVYDLVMTQLKEMSQPKPSFDPFTGPLKDRNGVLRVPAGKTMTEEELTSMEWAAPGVVGAWPNEPK